MKLGLLYEVQIPKPWTPGIEARTYGEVIEQVVLADQLGWGYVWACGCWQVRQRHCGQAGSGGAVSRDEIFARGANPVFARDGARFFGKVGGSFW